MRAHVLASMLVVACTYACAPRPPAEPGPPRGSAQVCVLRPEFLAAGVTMEVRDNGRVVGATRGSSYFCYLAAPGEHQITSIDDDTGPTLLRASDGARYWIHQEVTSLGGDVHAHLDFLDEPTAHAMLERIDTKVLVAVRGHEDREDAMPIAAARRR
jgi:hypothetical protein